MGVALLDGCIPITSWGIPASCGLTFIRDFFPFPAFLFSFSFLVSYLFWVFLSPMGPCCISSFMGFMSVLCWFGVSPPPHVDHETRHVLSDKLFSRPLSQLSHYLLFPPTLLQRLHIIISRLIFVIKPSNCSHIAHFMFCYYGI